MAERLAAVHAVDKAAGDWRYATCDQIRGDLLPGCDRDTHDDSCAVTQAERTLIAAIHVTTPNELPW